MRTILKLILILAALAAIGIVGYAYVGDMSPQQEDVVEPVILDDA